MAETAGRMLTRPRAENRDIHRDYQDEQDGPVVRQAPGLPLLSLLANPVNVPLCRLRNGGGEDETGVAVLHHRLEGDLALGVQGDVLAVIVINRTHAG